jgi:hypothetical protein
MVALLFQAPFSDDRAIGNASADGLFVQGLMPVQLALAKQSRPGDRRAAAEARPMSSFP